jgi:WD40 repeat protein
MTLNGCDLIVRFLDGKIYLWDNESGALLEVLTGHGEGSVNSVVWHPRNERMFASCSDDRTVQIWEIWCSPSSGTENAESSAI